VTWQLNDITARNGKVIIRLTTWDGVGKTEYEDVEVGPTHADHIAKKFGEAIVEMRRQILDDLKRRAVGARAAAIKQECEARKLEDLLTTAESAQNPMPEIPAPVSRDEGER
jgi:hypothetical protein